MPKPWIPEPCPWIPRSPILQFWFHLGYIHCLWFPLQEVRISGSQTPLASNFQFPDPKDNNFWKLAERGLNPSMLFIYHTTGSFCSKTYEAWGARRLTSTLQTCKGKHKPLKWTIPKKWHNGWLKKTPLTKPGGKVKYFQC